MAMGRFRDYARMERMLCRQYGGLREREFWWFTEQMFEACAAGRL